VDVGLSVEGLGQVVLEAQRGGSGEGAEVEAAVRRAVRGLLAGAQARVASSAPVAPVLVSIVSLAEGCKGMGMGMGMGGSSNSNSSSNSNLRAVVDAVDFIEFSQFILDIEGGKQWKGLPPHEVYRL
jgi:hypothetical protein